MMNLCLSAIFCMQLVFLGEDIFQNEVKNNASWMFKLCTCFKSVGKNKFEVKMNTSAWKEQKLQVKSL